MSWALILLFTYSSYGITTTSLPGFRSEADCMAAATAAISQMGARRALCVKQ